MGFLVPLVVGAFGLCYLFCRILPLAAVAIFAAVIAIGCISFGIIQIQLTSFQRVVRSSSRSPFCQIS